MYKSKNIHSVFAYSPCVYVCVGFANIFGHAIKMKDKVQLIKDVQLSFNVNLCALCWCRKLVAFFSHSYYYSSSSSSSSSYKWNDKNGELCSKKKYEEKKKKSRELRMRRKRARAAKKSIANALHFIFLLPFFRFARCCYLFWKRETREWVRPSVPRSKIALWNLYHKKLYKCSGAGVKQVKKKTRRRRNQMKFSMEKLNTWNNNLGMMGKERVLVAGNYVTKMYCSHSYTHTHTLSLCLSPSLSTHSLICSFSSVRLHSHSLTKKKSLKHSICWWQCMFGSLLSFTFPTIEQSTCGMFNVLQTLCIRSHV